MSETASKMQLSLVGWKVLQRNTLRGFAKVRLGKSLLISDVALHCSHGRRWAQFPAKPLLLSDGTAKKNEQGKIQYVPLLEWTDKSAADRFSEAVIDAVEKEYSGATSSEYES